MGRVRRTSPVAHHHSCLQLSYSRILHRANMRVRLDSLLVAAALSTASGALEAKARLASGKGAKRE